MDDLAEIRRLYYATTPSTIRGDLARAVELLKAIPTEQERERAAVFMDGLAEMRREWSRAERKGATAAGGRTRAGEKRR